MAFLKAPKSLKELIDKAGITQEAIINMSNDTPFGPPYDKFIENTAVDNPTGKPHNDSNEKEYGDEAKVFRAIFCVYMTALFLGLTREEINPRQLFGYAEDDGKAANNVVVKMIGKDVFVDKQALGWWLAEQKGKKKQQAQAMYEGAHAAVVNLFSKV